MPFVAVPKDLAQVKTKVALNLTKRQLFCFSVAGIVGIPIFLILKKSVETDIAMMIMIAVVFPVFACAIFERDGLPLEKYLKNVIFTKFLRPQTRRYETNNFYSAIIRQSQYDKEVQNIVNSQKQKSQRKTTNTRYRKR